MIDILFSLIGDLQDINVNNLKNRVKISHLKAFNKNRQISYRIQQEQSLVLPLLLVKEEL
ncbi:MAG: hypothetical protein RLZZ507_2710 [Cyanobacteriota bacterium]|jgi:hypothetical protein